MTATTKVEPTHIKYYVEAKKEAKRGNELYKLYLETQNPVYLYFAYLRFRKAHRLLNKLYTEIEGGNEIGEVGWFDLSKAFNDLAKRVTGGLQWLVQQAGNLASSVQSALANLGNQIREWITNAQRVLGEWWNVLCSHISNFPQLFREWLLKTKFGLDLSPALRIIEEKKVGVRNFIILYSRLKKTKLTGEDEKRREEILNKYGWIYNFLTSPLVKPVLFPLIGLKESDVSGIGEIGELPIAWIVIVIALCILIGLYEWQQINSTMAQLLKAKTEYKATETITKEIERINRQIDYYKKIGNWSKVKELEAQKQALLSKLTETNGESPSFVKEVKPYLPYVAGFLGLLILLLIAKKLLE